MATQMKIEKKRLNSEIKQYIKCIKRFKKANAHKENIKRLENYLLSLETRKNNLKK